MKTKLTIPDYIHKLTKEIILNKPQTSASKTQKPKPHHTTDIPLIKSFFLIKQKFNIQTDEFFMRSIPS